MLTNGNWLDGILKLIVFDVAEYIKTSYDASALKRILLCSTSLLYLWVCCLPNGCCRCWHYDNTQHAHSPSSDDWWPHWCITTIIGMYDRTLKALSALKHRKYINNPILKPNPNSRVLVNCEFAECGNRQRVKCQKCAENLPVCMYFVVCNHPHSALRKLAVYLYP